MKGKSLSSKIYSALGTLSLSQAVGILCSMVRVKLVALWIGPAGVALFGLFNSGIEMMASLTQLGLRSSAVRDIAVASQSRLGHIATIVRRWSVWLGVFGMAVMVVSSPLMSEITFGSTVRWSAFAALALVMFFSSVTNGEQAVMQGTQNLRRLASSSVWGAVIGLGCSVPMLYYGGERAIVPVLIVNSAAVAAMVWLGRVRIAPPSPVPSVATTWTEGKGFLKLGMFMTLSGFLSWAATYGLLSWLNRTAGDVTTGYFQTGSTILLRYVGVFFTAIALEFYPRIAHVADTPRRCSLLLNHEIVTLLRLVTPLLCLFVVMAPIVVALLYSRDFLPAVPFVAVASLGIAPRIVAWCFSYILISRSDGKAYLLTEALSVVYYIALVVIGFTIDGIRGFGWGFAAWYTLDMITLTAVGRFRCGVRLRGSTWVAITISVAAVWLALSVADILKPALCILETFS